MRATYVDTAHTATAAATAIDSQAGTDADRVIRKILVGKPTAGATLTLYSEANAYTGATTNIAFKYTFPTFGAGTPASDVIDFGTVGGDPKRNGLVLGQGGSITTSSAMQVTVLWDDPDA